MKHIIIDVPDNKKAVWKNGRIEFVDTGSWKSITTFTKALDTVTDFASKGCKEVKAILEEYNAVSEGSYSSLVVAWRIVVFALTNNEKRHLITGERWILTIELCIPGNIKSCLGNKILGRIKSEGRVFEIVGSYAFVNVGTGLGCFHSGSTVSDVCTMTVGFQSVSSQEIAKHLSTYFGKLLFEVQYGGINCDWEWID